MKVTRILVAAVAAVAVLLAADLRPPQFDPQHYLEHVKYLASPELRGRGTGMPELDKAASYIAKQFKEAGLHPADGKHFFQQFSVTTNARLGKHNHFAFTEAGKKKILVQEKQFVPFNFSSGGKFEGQVVFAGYGITAKEYNYDDYASVDVKNKFVLVLRHEPQEFDEKSVFSGKVYTEHSQFFSKATNAKMHGAKGVIFINDAGNHTADADDMEPFGRTVGPANAGIPFVQVKVDVAEKWLSAKGKDLKTIQADIDKDLKPQSLDLSDVVTVTLGLDIHREAKTVNNVVGYLPGETDEHIVIGAHYDHLGLGEQFSMAASQVGTPHLGADDNASGTAGVIEIARYFGGRPKPKRGIVFLCFAGEELGLLGSSYYVNNPKFPIEKAVAMINMDMIGRIREHKVYLGGLGTGTGFKEMLEELAKSSTLHLEFSDQTGYGSSDHTSFTTKQVPVLFFFSGLHADYHKPSDTWDKIDGPEAVKLLEVVAGVANRLAAAPERPQFVRVAEPAKPVSHAGTAATGSGYGPYFGSIPDMAEQKTGVKFADVREGSPAAKAGLKGGDTMVEFDGKPIQNLYDFTYALRAKKVGDAVKVKVLREGKPLEVEVTLERRR
ncbi:MAG: M28 family peptidase [Bryobacterales bacterium]|nr:M28 family peptidase [Bryobacterales bacterium]